MYVHSMVYLRKSTCITRLNGRLTLPPERHSDILALSLLQSFYLCISTDLITFA